MVAEALQYVLNHLDTIMTGLTMAAVGIGVYEARDGFFLFNGQFRGKYGALLIFLGKLFGASLITPIVSNLIVITSSLYRHDDPHRWGEPLNRRLSTPSMKSFEVITMREQSLPYIPPGHLLGAILVLGMFGVNKAAEWNFFDIKSLPVSGLGVVLIANPELVHAVA